MLCGSGSGSRWEGIYLLVMVMATVMVCRGGGVAIDGGGGGGGGHHEEFLEVHNKARAEVGVGPLSWNETLEAYAQRYANERIHDCDMEHSMGPYGENLAEGYGEMKGSDAVKFWLTEKPYYDYASNACVHDECLHYTQIVWRNSLHLGCARAKCNNGWMFVICSYSPPGNIIGERPY